MGEFRAEEAQTPNNSTEMQTMIGWVRKSLCRFKRAQDVIDKREYAPGQKVTSVMAHAGDNRAHGCPFVLDAINAGQFFIEQSSLGEADESGIETLIQSQIPVFKQRLPAYDPVQTGKPCPQASLLKTDLFFFPNVDALSNCPLLFRVLNKLKPSYMQNGMMLGEFFPGYKSGSLYNPGYNALAAPYPAFAIRYMVAGDSLFAQSALHKPLYEAYFPPLWDPVMPRNLEFPEALPVVAEAHALL